MVVLVLAACTNLNFIAQCPELETRKAFVGRLQWPLACHAWAMASCMQYGHVHGRPCAWPLEFESCTRLYPFSWTWFWISEKKSRITADKFSGKAVYTQSWFGFKLGIGFGIQINMTNSRIEPKYGNKITLQVEKCYGLMPYLFLLTKNVQL